MDDCECKNWCSDGKPPFLSHHRNCSKYNPEKELLELVSGLVRDVESWAADEDGVHSDCRDVYKKTRIVLGRFNVKTEECPSCDKKGKCEIYNNYKDMVVGCTSTTEAT